jgi:hypothetical protein
MNTKRQWSLWTPRRHIGTKSAGRLNFIQWRIIFVGSQYETCFMSLFWRLGFWGGAYSFGKYVHSWFHSFLISILDGGKWSASRPDRYTLNRRLDGSQKRSWYLGEEKHLTLRDFRLPATAKTSSVAHVGIRTPDSQTRGLVTIPTTLPRSPWNFKITAAHPHYIWVYHTSLPGNTPSETFKSASTHTSNLI